jgi:molecular chaperone GrpE
MAGNNHKKEEKKGQTAPSEAENQPEKAVTIKEEDYKELREAAGKAGELQEKLLRLQADFDNARKRMEKQCQDFAKYANEAIILELLTILDDLENATQMAENKNANLENFLKGIEMILTHLYEMLKSHGVKPIEVVGKPFDPHTSEAMLQVASELPEHTVVEELQRGYFLNDRVLRTAKVKVSKKSGQ